MTLNFEGHLGCAWVWTNLANLSQADSCAGARLVVQDATQESWVDSQTCLVVSKLWVVQADRDNRALCPSSSRIVQGSKNQKEKAKHNVSVLLDSLLNHVFMIL